MNITDNKRHCDSTDSAASSPVVGHPRVTWAEWRVLAARPAWHTEGSCLCCRRTSGLSASCTHSDEVSRWTHCKCRCPTSPCHATAAQPPPADHLHAQNRALSIWCSWATCNMTAWSRFPRAPVSTQRVFCLHPSPIWPIMCMAGR